MTPAHLRSLPTTRNKERVVICKNKRGYVKKMTWPLFENGEVPTCEAALNHRVIDIPEHGSSDFSGFFCDVNSMCLRACLQVFI